MDKSTRHSKITGDFGESLVLYWLSRSGFEATLVDHTGIDIVAYHEKNRKRYGISVKSRSRTAERSSVGMMVSGDNYDKMMDSCEFFACDVPSIAFVYDRPLDETTGKISVYLMPLAILHKYCPTFNDRKDFTFSINEKREQEYRDDSDVYKLDFEYKMKDWP